jgi:hypothetical protein
MPIHTIPANGRAAHQPSLTAAEAAELAMKGFRFSIFQPESGEFRLSYPLEVAEDRLHGTLTFVQEDARETRPARRSTGAAG